MTKDINEKITIRRWSVDDWETLKMMRLESLKGHSNVFLDNIENASKYDDEHWKDMLQDPYKGGVLGLYDANNAIGLAGVFRYRDSPEDSVILGMFYIRPEYRSRGLSTCLYNECLAWARSQDGIKIAIVSHREGNKESYSSIINQGFKLVSTEEKKYGDGTLGISHRYELKL